MWRMTRPATGEPGPPCRVQRARKDRAAFISLLRYNPFPRFTRPMLLMLPTAFRCFAAAPSCCRVNVSDMTLPPYQTRYAHSKGKAPKR